VFVLHVRDVNEALPKGIALLKTHGVRRESRNGPVLEAPEPVTTVYTIPQRRVLFCPVRDANPFFHLFEALWMLAGRNDVAFPAKFAKNMLNYSDDGETLNGAYGFRWRNWFGRDNLQRVIDALKTDPDTRRAYLPMWDGWLDGWPVGAANTMSQDYPCNVGVNFRLRSKRLHMTVFCRSNDIIWGCYGANVVHFSMLQEYVASHLKVTCGTYTQVSDSFHAYCDRPDWAKLSHPNSGAYEDPYYDAWYMRLLQYGENISEFDRDLKNFFHQQDHPDSLRFHRTEFFCKVVIPMLAAWENRDPKHLHQELLDWHIAGRAWLERRA
jgi:hypothetical protein